MTATGGGVFRAIGEWPGLAGERTPVIRIPADADEGDYRIRLAVRSPGRDSALVAGRELEIRR